MNNSAGRDWRVQLAALTIFIMGFAAGALALNIYRGPGRAASDAPRPRFGEMFDRLNLTDEQKPKVKAIFDEARTQMSGARKECAPKYRAVRERTDAQLREVLTPEQWEQFKSITSESRERRKRDHRDHADHPGGS